MAIIYKGEETNKIKIKYKIKKATPFIKDVCMEISDALFKNIDSINCARYIDLTFEDIDMQPILYDDELEMRIKIIKDKNKKIMSQIRLIVPLFKNAHIIISSAIKNLVAQVAVSYFCDQKYPKLRDYDIEYAISAYYAKDHYDKNSIVSTSNYGDILISACQYNSKENIHCMDILKNLGYDDGEAIRLMATKTTIWKTYYCTLYQIGILYEFINAVEKYTFNKFKQLETNYKVIEGKELNLEEIYNEFKKEVDL